ncbi:cysteine proteinase [Sodiomyces alkalinus F11]|uniref:Cysteine proteinase n=1 Tax=Sodiomyces alkalinus (strain CBS 110278 / VKM F-3762 / F11) TaxID=1314773 RepID=A0A3N2Q8J2_SODAK|nr:cysteine proteinase [Sodiomyces alkalinus F11]ROT43093.1 cysteine proteinase [Sodiomyces alkalinus F11]
MSRTVKPPSGGFRPQNSLNQPISGSAISGVQQASFTTQRFAPPAEEIEDVDDDIVETFNNVSSSGSTRPRRPGLISKKRPFPGDVEDVNRQDKRPTKPHRRNSSIEISSDSENPKAVDSAIKQGGKGQAAAEKMPANPQQHRERQEPQRPSEAPPLDRPAKKRRASNSSGDELVESTSSKAGRHTHDSVSSLNGHGPRTAKSAEPKGVIRKTTFKKQASKLSLAISRAVSSKWSLAATKLDSGDQPRLELVNPNRLRPVTARGPLQGYHWLEVKINTCHSIKYSSDGGLGVWIKRSAGDSIPGELALEFATSDDHNKFVSWCRERSRSGGLTKLIEEETSWFEKLFQKKLSEQKATAVHQAHKSEADDIRYLEHQERAMLARSAEKEQSKPPSESVEEERPTARRSLREGMKDEPPGPSSSTRASTLSPSGPNALRPLEPPRTRRALKNPTPPVAPVRERWIDKHPEWTEIWDKQPLIYPAKGRNPAQVAKDDMLRLEEGELLNDNLIVFYLRYLQTKLEKENKGLADRIYFMNPWFYQKLTHGKGRNINYDAVKSWTAKVDLLSHDYIVVPINEHMHWYLAIICHPSKLVPSEEAQEAPTKDAMQESKKQPEGDPAQLGGSASGEEAQAIDEDDVQIVSDLPFGPKSNHTSTSRMTSPKVQPGRKAKGMRQADPTEPRVITLDSLGGPHSRTCTNLRDYLVQEIKHRRNIDVEPPSPFGMTAKGIPEQDDFSSCGVYLLAYMERFLEDPDQVVRDITGKVDLRWNINTSKLRGEIRELIIKLRHEQNARIRAEKKTRLQAKAQNASSQKTRVGDAPTTAPKISVEAPRAPDHRHAFPLPRIRRVTPGSTQPRKLSNPFALLSAKTRPLPATRQSDPSCRQ